MPRFRAGPCSIGVAVALLISAMLVGVGQTPGRADVSAVQGSAYGFSANVGLFGGAPATRGPAPTVTLSADASNGPQTASAPTGLVQYGPALLFTSGPITVSTTGTTGPTGAVTSTASINTINTSGNEVFTAANLTSTCTANEAGNTGSTTVTGGRLVLRDPNPDTSGEAGEEIVNVPVNPAPNTTYTGVVANVNDNFRYVFNEQIVNPDGSLTVNAAHQYLLGPTAIGELIIGQSVCGVTATVVTTTTTSGSASTTSTTSSTSSTSSTVAPTTTTTTTVGPGGGTLKGSATGYFASISLFDGPFNTAGPTPTVTLTPDGSNSPQTASVTTSLVRFGPATLFSSGPIEATTGTLGSTGGVTSTATIGAINTSGQEIFTAGGLSSTCTADDSGATGSTTVTGGRIVLQDPNPDTTGEAGEEIVILPVNPDPNTTYEGTVANVNDDFRAVFNEQIVNPDGSLTVNAYHLELLGPTAVGDLTVGTVTCGVNTQVVPTTTTVAPTTSTTTRSGTGTGDQTPVGTAGNGGPGGNLARTGTRGPGALSLGILLVAGGLGSMLLGRRRRPATAADRPDQAA